MSEQNHEFIEVDEDLPFTDEEQKAPEIELSADLKKYANITDDAESNENEPDKKDCSKAEAVALGTLKAVEWAIEKWLGANTGLVDADRKQWAKDVAPALVKMGVTDYTGFLDRYKDYITAIVGTFTLGNKIAQNVMADLAAKEAAKEAEKEAQQQQQEQEQPRGLDGYDRDLATQAKLMAGAA